MRFRNPVLRWPAAAVPLLQTLADELGAQWRYVGRTIRQNASPDPVFVDPVFVPDPRVTIADGMNGPLGTISAEGIRSMAASAVIVLGAVLAAVAVGSGAFGAHGLEARLSERAMAIWQTAVQYQFVHALGLLLVAALWERLQPGWGLVSVVAMTLGVLLFSGSLYALALGAPRVLGAIAPIGGTLFIVGWAALAVAAAVGRA